MEAAMIELYHQGRTAFEENRYEDARKFFLKLMENGCRFADALNMLGTITFEDGDLPGAITYFQQALAINPRYTEAHLNLAVARNEQGQYPEGQRSFEAARTVAQVDRGSMDPYVKGRLANLHADIGEIYHGLGLHDDAVNEYRKALFLGPNFPDLRVRLGILYRDMGEYDSAIQEFEHVRKQHPGFPPAGVQLGITHYSRGNVPQAVEEWKHVLTNNPGNPKATMYLRLAEKESI